MGSNAACNSCMTGCGFMQFLLDRSLAWRAISIRGSGVESRREDLLAKAAAACDRVLILRRASVRLVVEPLIGRAS